LRRVEVDLALRIMLAGLIFMPLFSCTGKRPTNGVKDGRLAQCPPSFNCVSSDASEAAHRVGAFELALPAAEAWRIAHAVIAGVPRTKLMTETDDYLYAACSSAFFGFVDDLELHLRPSQNLIAARSASRLGHSDFGVNRKRIEHLRGLLRERGALR
jgi:uncharacterized protein (DUF1499 family)